MGLGRFGGARKPDRGGFQADNELEYRALALLARRIVEQ